MGVGSFKYTGEGFCYWDWHHAALSSVMLVITLPCILGTLALLLLAMRAGGWPSQLDLQLMLIAFLCEYPRSVPLGAVGGRAACLGLGASVDKFACVLRARACAAVRACSRDRAGCVAALACAAAWALWVPASLIGLAGGDFPRGYMISGGVMGHAQALINP